MVSAEEVTMPAKALRAKRPAVHPRKRGGDARRGNNKLTIRDLGWTREYAKEVRAKLATFAGDWDDPIMDVYNEP